MNEILMCGTDPVGQLYKDTKAEATSIAPIEVSPAESSHSVGTHIMVDGVRYRVTSAISIGDTLTIGTNISAENIEDNLNAEDVAYDSNTSVKEKIDEIGFKKITVSAGQTEVTINYSNCVQIDKTVFVDMLIEISASMANNKRLISDLPEVVSQDNFQFWGVEVKAYPNFSTTPIGFRVYNANNNGGIYPNTNISAGQFHIYGSYITS